jgi:hypothetical protein
VGVGLATLLLVFMNLSHRHGTTSELVGQGTHVEAGQRIARASSAGSASAIAHSGSRPASTPRFSASSAMAPERRSRSRLNDEASPADNSDPDQARRAWSAALRSAGNSVPTSVALQSPSQIALEPPAPDPVEPFALSWVEPSRSVAVEPSAQDEFGFEQ